MVTALQGSLRSFKLAELLSFLSGSRKSGSLTLQKGSSESTLYFEGGSVIYASSNQEQFRLGSLLLKSRKIDRKQLVALERDMMRTSEKFGRIALQKNLINEDELRDILKIQSSEVIYDCFVWAEGTFSFDDGPKPPEYAVAISLDLPNLMMEGARRIDEWSRCLQLLPDPKMVFRVVAHPETEGKIILTKEEWKILFLVNGRLTLDELCQTVEESPLSVYRVIYGLYANKLIEPSPPQRENDSAEELVNLDAATTLRQKRPPTQPIGIDTVLLGEPDDLQLLVSRDANLSYRDVIKSVLARLNITTPDRQNSTFSLTEQEYRIGRLRENEIQLYDLAVSGRHSRIFREEEGYLIEDLGSRNGTIVNGARVKGQLLRSGDVVRLGGTELIYEVL